MSEARSLSVAQRLRRRINRRFYRGLFAFYRTVFPTPSWTGAVPAGSRRRILVVRHDRVGDLIVTTPLLSFLKESLPGVEIDVLASPSNESLLRGDDRVARIFTNDHSWRGWLSVLRQLRARRYDVILSPIALKGLREGLSASLIAHRGTYKISSWRPVRYQGLFTAVVRSPAKATHMADQALAVGYRALGLPPHSAVDDSHRYPMRVIVDPAAERNVAALLAGLRIERFVAVNVSAAVAGRDWAPEHCAEVLALLMARHADLSVVLTPAPGKEEPTREVVRRLATPRVHVAPPLPLGELAALVRRAAAVISPSTALVHLASALERPVVALYAPTLPTDVSLWLPRGAPHRALSSELRGLVADIPAERVAAAFDELRAEFNAPPVTRAPQTTRRQPAGPFPPSL